MRKKIIEQWKHLFSFFTHFREKRIKICTALGRKRGICHLKAGFELEEQISKWHTKLITVLATCCGSQPECMVWKDRLKPLTKVGMRTDGAQDMLLQSMAPWRTEGVWEDGRRKVILTLLPLPPTSFLK